jgi:hypothetical protein
MKWLLRIVLVVVLLAVVLGFVPAFFAKQVIERSGTYALGVETTLDSASLSPWAGSFGLEGLKVANPAGFEAEHFLTLGSGSLDVELGSLLGDELRAERLELSDVSLVLEKNVKSSNVQVILDNLEKLEGEQTKGDEGKPKGEKRRKDKAGDGKTYFIGEIAIRGVEVEAALSLQAGTGVERSLKLPDIVLKDVGGKEGSTLSGLVATIVEAILEAAAEHGIDGLPAEILADLDAGLEELGAQAEKALEAVIDEAAGELEKKGKEALRDILGGGKDE